MLLLNGNQLVKLTDIVHELRAMQCLKTLSKLLNNSKVVNSGLWDYVMNKPCGTGDFTNKDNCMKFVM